MGVGRGGVRGDYPVSPPAISPPGRRHSCLPVLVAEPGPPLLLPPALATIHPRLDDAIFII